MGLITADKELVICTHRKNGPTLLTNDGTQIEQHVLLACAMEDAHGADDSFPPTFCMDGSTDRCTVAACRWEPPGKLLSPAHVQTELLRHGY